MIDRLVLFGALGDLTARYVLPALAALHAEGHLPDGFTLVGSGREELDDDAFRDRCAKALDEHADALDEASRRAVVAACTYVRADATDADDVAAAVASDDPVACYLALPPAVAAPAIDALAAAGLAEGSCVVLEKPFGTDRDHAVDLNRRLRAAFDEDAVFRVDHFFGKHTVQDVVALRFANRLFEPVWNRANVAAVEIVWDEQLTLEGRASYYDSAGALADMLQNHLLQVLALVAMEPPWRVDARELADRKADVLRAVRGPVDADDVAAHAVRGRYTAGTVGEREVPAYVDEEGVDPERGTETYAEVVLHVDTWRWSGVPFRLRSGKALGAERHEVVVHFQDVPHLAHEDEDPVPNRLRIDLARRRVVLDVNVNGPDEPFSLVPTELDVTLGSQEVPAYGQLLLGVLSGDPLLSIGADEAEEAWRIMDPVLAAWRDDATPIEDYPAGSGGPGPAPHWQATAR